MSLLLSKYGIFTGGENIVKEIIIDGKNFDDEEGFYKEIDKLLTRDLNWKTGHNLDAFNDLLRGGFGVHEYGEKLRITWVNASKSKIDFGYDATVEHWEKALKICHPTSQERVAKKICDAQNHVGQTLFDIIVDIIVDSDDTGHFCTLEIRD